MEGTDRLVVRNLCFLDEASRPDKPTYQVILNRKLKRDLFIFMNKRATTLICTDGGANALYDCFNSDEER